MKTQFHWLWYQGYQNEQMDKFDSTVEDWPIYIERLEQYFPREENACIVELYGWQDIPPTLQSDVSRQIMHQDFWWVSDNITGAFCSKTLGDSHDVLICTIKISGTLLFWRYLGNSHDGSVGMWYQRQSNPEMSSNNNHFHIQKERWR